MAFGILDKSTPSADQQFNPRFMRMYQLAKDQQAIALGKKKRKEQGLKNKLSDPNSKLNKGEKVMLKSMLRGDSIEDLSLQVGAPARVRPQ